MAENTTHQKNLEDIYNLLSPYLDGEVSDEERVLVEQALAESLELRQDLESLRQTIGLVAALPPMPAPRPFTLSEADVQPTVSVPKGRFRFPSWAVGLATMAAVLICVFVAGGVFLGNGSTLEIARVEDNVASQAVEAEAVEAPAEEAPAAMEAPAEPPAKEIIEESQAESAEPAEEEKAVVEFEMESTGSESVTENGIVSSDSDDTTSITSQPETTEDNEVVIERDANQGAVATTLPPTPSPMPTNPPLPTNAPEPIPSPTALLLPTLTATSPPPAPQATGGGLAEGGAGGTADQSAPAPATELSSETDQEEVSTEQTDDIAASEESALSAVTEAADAGESTDIVEKTDVVEKTEQEPIATLPAPLPADEAQLEQDLAHQDRTVRLVEIQDQRLQVQPGLIQIEGFIEGQTETRLVASLQRNQQPFDEWAEPASLQSVVQPDGRFSLNIHAHSGRADQNLFAIEPANYQIIIRSVEADELIMATVIFDTFNATSAPDLETTSPTPLPTASPTPTSTPTTPVVQSTGEPPITPDATNPVTSRYNLQSSNIMQWLLLGAGLVVLVILVIVGSVIWLNISKKH